MEWVYRPLLSFEKEKELLFISALCFVLFTVNIMLLYVRRQLERAYQVEKEEKALSWCT